MVWKVVRLGQVSARNVNLDPPQKLTQLTFFSQILRLPAFRIIMLTN